MAMTPRYDWQSPDPYVGSTAAIHGYAFHPLFFYDCEALTVVEGHNNNTDSTSDLQGR